LLDHLLCRNLASVEAAFHVHIKMFLKVHVIHINEGPAFHDRSVVHKNIHPAKLVNRGLKHLFGLGSVGYVCFHRNGTPAAIYDGIYGCFSANVSASSIAPKPQSSYASVITNGGDILSTLAKRPPGG
jgi:hypothetical protein